MKTANVTVGKPASRFRNRRSCVVVHASPERLPWLPNVAAGLLAGVIMTQVAPAYASPTSIARQGNDEAAEMIRIIQARTGRPLQSLQSSPNVAVAAPDLRATASKADKDKEALLAQLESMLKTLNEQKSQTAAASEEARLLRFEREQLKQQIDSTPAVAPVPAPVPAPAPIPTPAVVAPQATAPAPAPAPAAKAAEKEDKDGSSMNVLGLVVGAGAAGIAFMQTKKAETVETDMASALVTERKMMEQLKSQADGVKANLQKEQELVSKLKTELTTAKDDSVAKMKELEDLAAKAMDAEKAKVQGLKAQAETVRANLEKEQELVSALKSELMTAKDNNVKLKDLELKEKAAAKRVEELAAKAMEAEQAKVVAVKAEVAAAQELMQSERAAKFVAEAEIQAMQAKLKDASEQLARGVKVGEDLNRVLAETQAQVVSGQVSNEEMKSKLAVSEAAVASGKSEALTMQNAMGSLRIQADEINAKAQRVADEAAAERAAADAALVQVTNELKDVQNQVTQARQEAAELDKSRSQAASRVAALEGELAQQKTTNASMSFQLAELQRQAKEADAMLSDFADAKKEMIVLRTELMGVSQQLLKSSDELRTERGKRELMETTVATLKAEFEKAGADLENERSVSNALKKEGETLKRQVAEAQASSTAMREQLMDMNLSFNQKLGTASRETKLAEEKAVAAAVQLESVRAEVARAVAANESTQTELGAEKDARSKAELSLSKLRNQLDTMLAATEKAKVQAEESMINMKSTMADLQKRRASMGSGTRRVAKPDSGSNSNEGSVSSTHATAAANGVPDKPEVNKVGSKAARSDKVVAASKVDAAAAALNARRARKAVVTAAAADESMTEGQTEAAAPVEAVSEGATPVEEDVEKKVKKITKAASHAARPRSDRVVAAATAAGGEVIVVGRARKVVAPGVSATGEVLAAKRGPGRPRKVAPVADATA